MSVSKTGKNAKRKMDKQKGALPLFYLHLTNA